ncbi:hypothetical protein ACQUQP_16165 [Marinobacterium sp. YM272]|uniref:hypothetical protein n=1 Tax=Marinobacterium sp. YM272 TaxID=3421654 RepID=UPI003D7FB207
MGDGVDPPIPVLSGIQLLRAGPGYIEAELEGAGLGYTLSSSYLSTGIIYNEYCFVLYRLKKRFADFKSRLNALLKSNADLIRQYATKYLTIYAG